MKNRKKCYLFAVIAAVSLSIALSFSGFAKTADTAAAGQKSTTAQKTTAAKKTAAVKKPRWVSRNGYWYYLNEKGKRVKGRVKIGKKYYYFDNSGRQRYGWRKIGKYYYRFRKHPGAKGYMYTSTVKDGIRISKAGRAVLKTASAKRRISVLEKYALWADTFWKIGMNREERMNACLSQMFRFRFQNEAGQQLTGDWDLSLADMVYARLGVYPYLECYGFAGGFAYLLNAVGISEVEIRANSGHGWTTVRGVAYDAARTVNRGDGYFPVADENFKDYYIVWRKSVG